MSTPDTTIPPQISAALDDLKGLKENVIVGRLIPAGTGLAYHTDRRRKAAQTRDVQDLEAAAIDESARVEEALKEAFNASDI